MKGIIRWDKLHGTVDNLAIGDQDILALLGSLEKNFKWIDLIPVGLRASYVSVLQTELKSLLYAIFRH